jgi:hypothetical protein
MNQPARLVVHISCHLLQLPDVLDSFPFGFPLLFIGIGESAAWNQSEGG